MCLRFKNGSIISFMVEENEGVDKEKKDSAKGVN